jgi:fructokinase
MTLQRIFVLGEALVDVVRPAAGRPARTLPGGSPANVAVGLARLGIPATLATGLGADEHGRLVGAHLAEAGVAVLNCAAGAGPTSVARVSFDASGEPGYDFALSWEIEPVALPNRRDRAAHRLAGRRARARPVRSRGGHGPGLHRRCDGQL